MLGPQQPPLAFGYAPAGDKSNMQETVKKYIAAGLRVLLVQHDSKIPATVDQIMAAKNAKEYTGKKGVYLATSDPKIASAYVRQYSKIVSREAGFEVWPNIGVALTGRSFIVADADTPQAVAHFRKLWQDWGGDPDYLTDVTGSGGCALTPTVATPGKKDEVTGEMVHSNGGHYYLMLPDGVDLSGTVAKFDVHGGIDGDGVSIMVENCYVLAPPSVRPEGPYCMVGSPLPCPPGLIDEIVTRGEGVAAKRNRAEGVTQHQEAEAGAEAITGMGLHPLDEATADLDWDTLLVERGFRRSGTDSCGCATYRAPGRHSSSKSVTAHEEGCSEGYGNNGGVLHFWTDNPPEEIQDWFDNKAPGSKRVTKIQFLAAYDHNNSIEAAGAVMGAPLIPNSGRINLLGTTGVELLSNDDDEPEAEVEPWSDPEPLADLDTVTPDIDPDGVGTEESQVATPATARTVTDMDSYEVFRELDDMYATDSSSYTVRITDDVKAWAEELSQSKGLGRTLSQRQKESLAKTAHPNDNRVPVGVTPGDDRDRIYPAGVTNDPELYRGVFDFSDITRKVFWEVENDETRPQSPVAVLMHQLLRVARRIPPRMFSGELAPGEEVPANKEDYAQWSLLARIPLSYYIAVCGRSGSGKTNSSMDMVFPNIEPIAGTYDYGAAKTVTPDQAEADDQQRIDKAAKAAGDDKEAADTDTADGDEAADNEAKEDDKPAKQPMTQAEAAESAAAKMDRLSDAASPQALGEMLMDYGTNEDGSKFLHMSKHPVAGVEIDELTSLLQRGATNSEGGGSGMLPALASAWSSKNFMPASIRNGKAGLTGKFTVTIEAGIQPKKSAALLTTSSLGLLQRFYLIDASYTLRGVFTPREIRLPKNPHVNIELPDLSGVSRMTACAEMVAAFDANARVSAAPELADDGEDEAQGIILRARAAMLCALAHGQTHVDSKTWKWSGYLMELHRRTLAMVRVGADEDEFTGAIRAGQLRALTNLTQKTEEVEAIPRMSRAHLKYLDESFARDQGKNVAYPGARRIEDVVNRGPARRNDSMRPLSREALKRLIADKTVIQFDDTTGGKSRAVCMLAAHAPQELLQQLGLAPTVNPNIVPLQQPQQGCDEQPPSAFGTVGGGA